MATTASSSKRWPTWLPAVGWSLLGLLGLTLLVFMATITFGGVHGTEFCPQTFKRRSYSYYELPVLGIQVTGERLEDLTGDTEKTITSKGYIHTPSGGKQDWHVLAGSRAARERRPGDAGILTQYLDATDVGSNHRWEDWTEKHDEQAKILWPAIQQLALAELYIFVPDLFDLAKRVSDAAELKAAIDKILAEQLPSAASATDASKPAGKGIN